MDHLSLICWQNGDTGLLIIPYHCEFHCALFTSAFNLKTVKKWRRCHRDLSSHCFFATNKIDQLVEVVSLKDTFIFEYVGRSFCTISCN